MGSCPPSHSEDKRTAALPCGACAAGQERRRTPVGQVHILTPTDTSQTPPVRSLTPTTAARKGTPLSGDRSLDRGPPSDRLPDGSPLPAGGADVAGSSGPGGVRAPQRNFSSSSLSGIDANGTQGAGGAGAAAGEEAGLRVEGGGGGEGEGEEGADAGAGGLDAPTGGEFRSFLPPPPTARCGDDLQAKFAKFLQLKREGTNFNTALRLSKGYRNPDLMQQLVTLHSIRETGSMFERAVFDPQGYADADFYDRLVVQQRQEADRREAERKLRTQIQFQPGGQYLPPGGKPVVQIFTGQKGELALWRVATPFVSNSRLLFSFVLLFHVWAPSFTLSLGPFSISALAPPPTPTCKLKGLLNPKGPSFIQFAS
eukprot:jgi/Mesen1/7525/ME000039S06739